MRSRRMKPMSPRTRIGLVILCVATSFVAWMIWAWYTMSHYNEPLTWRYAIGSGASLLAPLLIALVLLSTGG
jgi:hypothetical protein